jgi:hypothetical protein
LDIAAAGISPHRHRGSTYSRVPRPLLVLDLDETLIEKRYWRRMAEG